MRVSVGRRGGGGEGRGGVGVSARVCVLYARLCVRAWVGGWVWLCTHVAAAPAGTFRPLGSLFGIFLQLVRYCPTLRLAL